MTIYSQRAAGRAFVSAVCAFAGLGILVTTGCQSARVAHPLPQKLYAPDADAQMEFWHSLASEKLASNDEAFHALLLYLDQSDSTQSYADRVKVLKSRKLLPASFDQAADEAVTRGTLAVAIVRVLQIKGGLMMHIVGPMDPRYATRELQYQGVYPPSSANQTFSGTEMVGIIGKLDDVQHGVAAPVTARLKE